MRRRETRKRWTWSSGSDAGMGHRDAESASRDPYTPTSGGAVQRTLQAVGLSAFVRRLAGGSRGHVWSDTIAWHDTHLWYRFVRRKWTLTSIPPWPTKYLPRLRYRLDAIPHRRHVHGQPRQIDGRGAEGREDNGIRSAAESSQSRHASFTGSTLSEIPISGQYV